MSDSRKILFMKKLLGEDVELPEVISRIDAYLNFLNGNEQSLPEPQSRIDKYLAYLCGMSVEIPEPISRSDKYLYSMCGGEVELPEEVSDSDKYYKLLIDSGFPNVDIEELLSQMFIEFIVDCLYINYDSRLKMDFLINDLGEMIVDSNVNNTTFNLNSNGELEVVYSI